MNKAKLTTITPDVARDFLQWNTRNLPVRPSVVDFYASEMSAGRWALTHQGIAFGEIDGIKVLIDGQHRLLACVQSGVTIEAWVTWDAPIATQVLVDKGRIRSVADELLHFNGVQYASKKTSAARCLISLCCNFQNIKMSNGMADLVIGELGREMDFVIEACKNFRPADRTWVLAVLSFAYSADRSLGVFIEAFGSGENLKHGDPAKALRDWLTNGGRSITANYKRAAIEGVFNACYNATTGNSISTIKRGANGLDYFTGKKRRFVTTVRESMRQQMELSAA